MGCERTLRCWRSQMHERKMTKAQLIAENMELRKKIKNLQKQKSFHELERSRNATLNLLEDLQMEIKERKQVEKQLRDSEQRLSLALECIGVGLWDHDCKTNRVFRNSQWAEMLGYSPEEVKGNLNFWKSLIHPSDREKVQQAIQDHEDGKTKVFDVEHRLRTKTGEYKWIRNWGKLVDSDADGKPVRAIGLHVDIDESKKTTFKLHESERRFRSMIENTSDAVYCYEFITPISITLPEKTQIKNISDCRLVECNDACALYYGYSKADQIRGKKLEDLTESVSEGLGAIFTGLVKNRYHIANEEKVFVSQDNQIRYFVHHANGVIENGQLLRFWGSFREITDRKSAEQALQENEEKYRQLFEQAVDIVMLHQYTDQGAPGKFIEFNQRSLSVLGYSKKELSNKTPMDIIVSEDHGDVKKETNNLLTQKESLFERTIVTKAGQHIPVEIHASLFEYKGEKTTLAIIRDISERKKYENLLLESEQRFKGIIENTEAGYFFIDEKGIIRGVNKAWLKMYKYHSSNEVLGRHFTETQKMEDVRLAQQFVQGIMEGKSEYMSGEFSRKCKDGSIGYHTFTSKPALQSGKVIGIEGFIIDITDRKKMEADLQMERDLLRRITETSPIGIVRVDHAGQITFANQRAEEILHLKRDSIKLLTYNSPRWSITDFEGNPFNDKDLPFNQVKKSGKSVFNVEHAIEWPDGQRRLLSVNAAPVYDSGGQFEAVIASIEDVTEMRQLQEDLRKQNKMTQEILDNLPVGLAINSIKEGMVIYINRQFQEIYGWPLDMIQDISAFFEHVYPDPEYRKIIQERVMADIMSGDPKRMSWDDVEVTGQDGTKRMVSAKNIPLADLNIMISTVWDITEQKRAEFALRESEEKFRSLYETMSEGVSLHEMCYDNQGHPVDYRILDVNPGFEKNTAINARKAKNSLASKLYSTDSPPFLDIYSRVADTGDPDQFEVFWEPMKRYFNISVVSPKKGQFATIFTDITDRKHADEEIQKLAKFPSENPHPVLRIRTDGVIVYANQAAEPVLRFFKKKVNQKVRKSWQQIISQVAETGLKQDMEISTEGQVFSFTLTPVANANYVNLYGHDITARRNAEQIIQRHHEELQRLSMRLIQAQEEERKKLSRELHDEMGQSLTAIKLNLAEIEKDDETSKSSGFKEMVHETEELVDNLLDQMHHLALELRPNILDDLGLIPALRWYVKQYAKRRNVSVQLKMDDKANRLPPQYETILYRIVQETLNNIAKYANASQVSIRLQNSKDNVTMNIRDNGQGFDLAEVEARPVEKQGIGLLGMHERVSGVRGMMTIRSKPGKGTTLKIVLPLP